MYKNLHTSLSPLGFNNLLIYNFPPSWGEGDTKLCGIPGVNLMEFNLTLKCVLYIYNMGQPFTSYVRMTITVLIPIPDKVFFAHSLHFRLKIG